MVYLYKKKFPNPDDVVCAKIDKITQLGIEVSLIEYDNIKGYISYSEVSRKKNFNVNQILKIGHDVNLIVITVDHDKGYIDLSKRIISEYESNNFSIKLKKYMQLYNLWKYIYRRYYNIKTIDENLLYKFLERTLWYLQSLEIFINDNDLLYSNIINIDSNIKTLSLLHNYADYEEGIINNSEIRNNITESEIRIKFNITNFKNILDDYIKNKINISKPSKKIIFTLLTLSENGLDDIKYVLDYKSYFFYDKTISDFELDISYISASKYKIIINQRDFVINNESFESIDNVEEHFIDIITERASEKNITLEFIQE